MRDKLFGFGPSVYSRSVRIALAHLERPYDWVEVDPFTAPESSPHPVGRVPVWEENGFAVFETGAILRHINRTAAGALTPKNPRAATRMDQVIGLVDAYGYWPLVRQVYVHGAARGLGGDASELAEGLRAAAPVLDMLEEIAAEGLVLNGERSLADCHLAPMLTCFVMVPAARAALAERPALSSWMDKLADWAAFVETATPPGAE